jgi:hypothetical protein
MAITATSTGITFNSGNSKTTGAAFGTGQTWQSVSRGLNTTYTNSTGRPILVVFTVRGNNNSNSFVNFYVDAIYQGSAGSNSATRDGVDSPICCVVPNGSTYHCDVGTGSPSMQLTYEFR